MTDPRPRPRPRATIPASQRHAEPLVADPDTAPIPIPPPTVQTRTDEQQPDVEWPRCWDCGWSLLFDLVGDLWCPHWACEQYRRVVGTLVADRAVSDRLREAIDQANGEQRDNAQEPPQH